MFMIMLMSMVMFIVHGLENRHGHGQWTWTWTSVSNIMSDSVLTSLTRKVPGTGSVRYRSSQVSDDLGVTSCVCKEKRVFLIQRPKNEAD
jgi:hypothetical protein